MLAAHCPFGFSRETKGNTNAREFRQSDRLVCPRRKNRTGNDASVRQALTSLLQSVALRVEAFGSAADFLKKGHVANDGSLSQTKIRLLANIGHKGPDRHKPCLRSGLLWELE